MSKPTLITGTSGQIGLCIRRRAAESAQPLLLCEHSTPLAPYAQNETSLPANLSQPDAFAQDFQAHTLIHSAPLWLLPGHIPILSAKGIKRLIAFSSTSIMGKENSGNKQEQATILRLKQAEGEIASLCDTHNIAYTILRPTLIYGLGMDANVTLIARFIQRFGLFPLYPPAKGLRQPVHADDLATAALAIQHNTTTHGKTYALSGGETLSYRDMALRIFEALDTPPRLIESRLLPAMLSIYATLTGSSLTPDMARRMNDNLAFSHEDATRDFSYAPRLFLSNGKDDIFPSS